VNFNEIWEKIKCNWILSAAVTGIAGLILLIFPGAALTSACYCIGGVAIAAGVIRTVRYFKQDHTYPFMFQSDLIVGLLTIGLGIFMIANPSAVLTILPYVLGLMMIGCGIGNILRSIDAKNAGFMQWGVLLALAIITIVLGWVIVGNPIGASEAAVAFIGGCLLYESITDFMTTFVVSKKIKTWKEALKKA